MRTDWERSGVQSRWHQALEKPIVCWVRRASKRTIGPGQFPSLELSWPGTKQTRPHVKSSPSRNPTSGITEIVKEPKSLVNITHDSAGWATKYLLTSDTLVG